LSRSMTETDRPSAATAMGAGLPGALPGEARRSGRFPLSVAADLAAAAVIVFAFASQFRAMRDNYLGPDEALHLWFSRSGGLADVVAGSRNTAHPPLFFLVLHVWMGFARSEFFLRVLPVFFGAAFLWALYRWSLHLFGKTAGFFTLLLAAASPAFLSLSSEVRGYSLFLLLLACGLAEFERGVEADSPARLALSAIFFWGAILTHYAALFVVLAFAVYSAARLRGRRASRAAVLAWAGGQAGSALLYLFLYETHLRTLRESEQGLGVTAGWLVRGFFRPGSDGIVSFLVRQVAESFRYRWGAAPFAVAGSVGAAAGIVILAARRKPSALLLVLPAGFGAAAGLIGRYPFGGTRHSIYLLPFLSAAIGVALAAVVKDRIRVALVASLLLLPLFLALSREPESRSLRQMYAAIERIRRQAPPGSFLFTDYSTGLVLRHYLGDSGSGGYRLANSLLWDPAPRTFADEVERLVRVHHLSAGQRFWVVRAGADAGLREVPERFSTATSSSAWEFGDIRILEVQL
jgi:hypothetical protein